MTLSHDSKEFFIDEKMILVRPLAEQEPIARFSISELISATDYIIIGEIDFPLESVLATYCGVNTDVATSAVFVAVPEETGSSDTKDALPAGVALYVQNPTTHTHELSILVRPEYKTTRLPLELLDSLVLDAAENGVQTLSTTDTNDDSRMRSIAHKTGMSVRLDNKHFRQTRYTLQVDKHPGTVVF